MRAERRRIARLIHDGVLPDIAGASYALTGLQNDEALDAEARMTLDRVVTILRRDVEWLRSLLGDIYPPGLEGATLASPLRDLAAELSDLGLDVDLELAAGVDISSQAAAVAYRVVREALQNVVTHADASQVRVVLARDGNALVVRVEDDGKGLQDGAEAGHFGLRMLADTLAASGGRLIVTRRDTGGTRLEAVLPADGAPSRRGHATRRGRLQRFAGR